MWDGLKGLEQVCDAPQAAREPRRHITVDDVTPILASLKAAGWPLFLEPEEVWYRAGTSETGVRQFLVQDPDGYLVRFSQSLGQRPAVKLDLP